MCIALNTKYWGYEISWELLPNNLQDPAIRNLCGSPPNFYYQSGSYYATDCDLTAGYEYTLHCRDSYGDGWNHGYLTIQGEEYCKHQDCIAAGDGYDCWWSATNEKLTINCKWKLHSPSMQAIVCNLSLKSQNIQRKYVFGI